jgi:hypothetical protein
MVVPTLTMSPLAPRRASYDVLLLSHELVREERGDRRMELWEMGEERGRRWS